MAIALSVLVLAIGLAMDATAVAASRGLAARSVRPREALLVGGLFGGAQALMPALGWRLGAWLGPLIAAWDHWIAFGLLAFIGGKMLYEAREQGDDDGDEPKRAPFALAALLVLAVATSIDAFAAGIGLPLLGLPPLVSIATIGGVTAALSYLGVYAGRRFGALLGQRLEVFGGLILIGLGVKVLVEHTLV